MRVDGVDVLTGNSILFGDATRKLQFVTALYTGAAGSHTVTVEGYTPNGSGIALTDKLLTVNTISNQRNRRERDSKALLSAAGGSQVKPAGTPAALRESLECRLRLPLPQPNDRRRFPDPGSALNASVRKPEGNVSARVSRLLRRVEALAGSLARFINLD